MGLLLSPLAKVSSAPPSPMRTMGNTQANGGGGEQGLQWANTQVKGPAKESGSVPVNANVHVAENGAESGNGQVTQNGNALATHHTDQTARLREPLNVQQHNLQDITNLLLPLFPLEEELVISMLTTFATGALTGISTINGFAAFGVASTAPKGALQALLHMSPFTFLPIGIMGVVLAIAVTRSRRYISVATCFLLFELLYTIILGAFCSIIKLNEDVYDEGFWAVLGITFVLCAMVVGCWSFVFPYPKCLRRWYKVKNLSGFAAAKEASARAVEAAAEAKNAMDDAIAGWKVALEHANKAQKAANDAITADNASQQAKVSEQDAVASASAAKLAAKGASKSAIDAEGAAVKVEQATSKAHEGHLNAEAAYEKAKKLAKEAEAAKAKAIAKALETDPAYNV